jgi:hypothetical protein
MDPTVVIILRALLIVDIIAMALLAVFYLRRRQLSWVDYCGFGLLAVLLPVVGPFVVIALRPGRNRTS